MFNYIYTVYVVYSIIIFHVYIEKINKDYFKEYKMFSCNMSI